jgi:ATP-dependent helicase/nuclease subunit B
MKLGAFPAEASFLPALASLWLAEGGDSSDGILILPSRRAAQALAGAFLAQNNGKALLLPRIIALGAIDEAGLSLAGTLDLPPAIAPMQRQAILAKLILGLNGADGAPKKLHAAWALAADLATLMDEADYAEIDLAETLPGVVAAELASHWQTTLDFLKIITIHWPHILAHMGRTNAASRQVALIDAQNIAWQNTPPAQRVWMVAPEGNPAVCRLARTVASLDQGFLLLPGYDAALSDEAWETLDDSHAQGGIARLLGAIGARRDEILRLPAPVTRVPEGRSFLLSRALLPAASLGDWQQPVVLETAGLTKLEAQDEAHNAAAIAMILRDALEVPGRTAALITPDRGLATRVAAALKRFGITADDSAGEPLEQTAPAVLLRLLARAAITDYAPLPFLALLKHPLTAAGLPPERCREHARRLETNALRGPRPAPGFSGIKFRLEQSGRGGAEMDFLDRFELLLRPLNLPLAVNPALALRALLQAAEQIAATTEQTGAAKLWSGEAGIALSELLLEALAALEDLPDISPLDLADLLDELLSGAVVRKPRTKDGHPRIAIWGVQEAALQSVDVAVLGGLVEGVWPAPAEPGPWLSRPMRKAAGLPAGEQKIGQAAHDFFSLASSCTAVILAAPARRDRAPAVPARWLTRLEAMLAGSNLVLPRHDAASWAAQLDIPISRIGRPKPQPRPPEETRPRTLSISDFATLMADPYAIYARKILNIRELDGLDKESDPQFFGEIVHAGLAEFFADPGNFDRPDAAQRLNVALQTAMRKARPRAALEHWWAARLERIAGWIFETEQARRAERGAPAAVALERSASLMITGGFELKGRADRIERALNGGITLVDYKTGSPPSAKDVEAGTAPQLALEAVMAEAGAFGEEFIGTVMELAYLKLSGRHSAGEEKTLFGKKPETLRAVIDTAAGALPEIFEKFARAETPYLAAPHPQRATYADVYAGISRRAEWAGEAEGQTNDGD